MSSFDGTDDGVAVVGLSVGSAVEGVAVVGLSDGWVVGTSVIAAKSAVNCSQSKLSSLFFLSTRS